MFRTVVLLLLAGSVVSAGPALAVDLTTPGATATIQSVIFTQGNAGPLSTPFIPFLRIQAAGVEQGFNTDFRPLEPDAIGTTVTHSLSIGSLQRRLLTTPQTTDYYFEFHLDVNEGSTAGNSFLSLDQLRFYSASTPDIATAGTLTSTATLRYDMDQPSDQVILLDSALEPGTGSVDLTIRIPTWYFSGVSESDYLYLLFRAGDQGLVGARDYGSSGGFEEMLALVWGTSGVSSEAAVSPTPWIRVVGARGDVAARFRCSVPGAGRVGIALYDVRGRRVAELRRDTAGPAVFEAPLSAFGGDRLGSGIYFYRYEWSGVARGRGKVALVR